MGRLPLYASHINMANGGVSANARREAKLFAGPSRLAGLLGRVGTKSSAKALEVLTVVTT